MVDIASELIEFKSKTNGKLSSMEQSISALSSKIDSLKNICLQTSASISAAYKSSNKDALLSKFENINTVYDKIKSVMTGEINSVLTKASNLLSNINSLEAKKSEIDSLSSRMNSANENYQQVSNNYNLKLSEFNELQTKSLNMLKELKSTDGEITFQEEFQVETIQEVRQNLQFGSYQRYHYTSSTNYQMSYYLYKPDYGSDAANSNLPTLVYFPGQGEQGNNTNAKGLPALINQKKITPAGMVLIPQVKSMEDPKYRQAIMELIDHVITENKGDKNRISISGHSIGATMGYKFLEENPDYFAAFVPVSGKANRVMDDAGNISNSLCHS